MLDSTLDRAFLRYYSKSEPLQVENYKVVCVALIFTNRGLFIGVQGGVTDLVMLVTRQVVTGRPSHEAGWPWSSGFTNHQLGIPLYHLLEGVTVKPTHSPYLHHGFFVEFFTFSWAVERWNLSSVSLLLSLFLKSIGENMVTKIIWFLNLRHSGTLFGVYFLTLAQQMFLFHPTL
jgi:hypothetical protein